MTEIPAGGDRRGRRRSFQYTNALATLGLPLYIHRLASLEPLHHWQELDAIPLETRFLRMGALTRFNELHVSFICYQQCCFIRIYDAIYCLIISHFPHATSPNTDLIYTYVTSIGDLGDVSLSSLASSSRSFKLVYS